MPHSDEIPVPVFKELPLLENVKDMTGDIVEHDSDVEFEERGSTTRPHCFNQVKLNDLVRDLNLSKEASELLALRLNEKNLLQHGTKVTFYCSRGKALLQCFRVDSDLVYCHDVSGLLYAMGVTLYDPNEW